MTALADPCATCLSQSCDGTCVSPHTAVRSLSLTSWQTEQTEQTEQTVRRLRVTPATELRFRRVKWAWENRLPIGALTLLAGREGMGKSSLWADLAAKVTRGTLPGEYVGQQRSVVVVATEDSWAHTIGPRLVAADADLTRIVFVDAEDAGTTDTVTLPLDTIDLKRVMQAHEAVLLVLDPLVSAMHSALDSHRDRDVRQALEPLSSLADRVGAAVIGLVHYGKSSTTDPVSLILGSRGFPAVARNVIAVAPDPNAEGAYLFTIVKANLGTLDVPALRYTITSATVPTDEGPTSVSRVVWADEVSGRRGIDVMRDALADAVGGDDADEHHEAAAWLVRFLRDEGGEASSQAVYKQAKKDLRFSPATLRRVATKMPDGYRVTKVRKGFPAESVWTLTVDEPQSAHSAHSAQSAKTSGDVIGQDDILAALSDEASEAPHESPSRVSRHVTGQETPA